MLAGKPFMKATREFYGILEKKNWKNGIFFVLRIGRGWHSIFFHIVEKWPNIRRKILKVRSVIF